MDKTEIIRLLEQYSRGELKLEETAEQLSVRGLEEMGFATLDTDRHNRTGIPEVIYSEGKTPQQLADIAGRMNEKGIPILATRATREIYEAVLEQVPGAIYHEHGQGHRLSDGRTQTFGKIYRGGISRHF